MTDQEFPIQNWGSANGPTVNPQPTHRIMPSYAVFKSELDSIGTFDSLTNLFTGLAGVFWGASLGFAWNLVVTIKITDDGWLAAVSLTVLSVLLGGGTAVLAAVFFCKKKGLVKGITEGGGTQVEAIALAGGGVDYGWLGEPVDPEPAETEAGEEVVEAKEQASP